MAEPRWHRTLLLSVLAVGLLTGCSGGNEDQGRTEADAEAVSEKLPPATMSIHEAALTANLGQLKAHLAWGSNLDSRDENGCTPMHLAASRGHLDVLEFLVSNGADVNAQDKQGVRVCRVQGITQEAAMYLVSKGAVLPPSLDLKEAIDTGNLDEVTLHIKSGLDLSSRSIEVEGQQVDPLRYALAFERPEIAMFLLEQGADPSFCGEDEYDALMLAADRGNWEFVRKAIDGGADPHKWYEQGGSLLDCAAMDGNLEMTKYLHKLGVKSRPEHERGPSYEESMSIWASEEVALYLIDEQTFRRDAEILADCFGAAMQMEKVRLFTKLVEIVDDIDQVKLRGEYPLLLSALLSGDRRYVDVLLDAGIELQATYDHGTRGRGPHQGIVTSLHGAAFLGEPDLFQKFLDRYGDLSDIPNVSGLISYASRHPECLAMLEKEGIELGHVSDEGRELILDLVRSARADDLSRVLKSRIDPDLADEEGTPVIHLALKFPKVIQVLADAGADLNALNSDGQTPLYAAFSLYKCEPYVNALVDAGADPNAKDNEGYTVLQRALTVKGLRFVPLLCKAGADPNLVAPNEKTALFLALESGPWGDETESILTALFEAGADPSIPYRKWTFWERYRIYHEDGEWGHYHGDFMKELQKKYPD